MGYFNINSILYNFRKIFKYLSISLAFISFIIVCLLLMSRDANADSSYNYPSFPSDAYNYNSIVVTINVNGHYRLICSNNAPVYDSASGEIRYTTYGCWYSYDPNNDNDWVFYENFSSHAFVNNTIIYSNLNVYYTGGSNIYFPASPVITPTPTPTIPSTFDYPPFPSIASNFQSHVVIYSRGTSDYWLLLSTSVPVANPNLGELRFQTSGQLYLYNPLTDSDWVYGRDFPQYDIPLNFSAIASGGFNPVIYTNEDIKYYGSNDVWLSTYNKPYIALPNDSTQTYISGEFSQFMVVGNDDIEDLQFFLTADPDVLPTTNSLALNLDENSPYYLDNYTPSDGGKVFLISKYDLPQGYTNDTPYHAWLAYRYNNQVYLTDVISWTTNFTAKAIENDRIRMESGMADSLSNINGILKDRNYNFNTLISGLPNSDEYVSPTDSGFSTLFNSLYSAFTTSNSVPVRFYIPFTNDDYIEIPADIISSHLPNTIVFLIQAFYWYLICRFIVKDIARIAQKIKSGEFLEESTGNIKTDLL